ncbi:MAG: hypothetical protein Q9209_006503 [Squamulea sp. 1 TL-2023]
MASRRKRNVQPGLEHGTPVAGNASTQFNRRPHLPPPPSLEDLEPSARVPGEPTSPHPIVRHVPGTRTIVYAHLQDLPIGRDAIGWTIRQMQYTVEGVMLSVGDGWLPEDRDPYLEDHKFGCYISMGSSKLPGPGGVKQHLTWGIMNSTLAGLMKIAYIEGYAQEMRFDVLDSGWGMVAYGYIKAGFMYSGLKEGGGVTTDTTRADS